MFPEDPALSSVLSVTTGAMGASYVFSVGLPSSPSPEFQDSQCGSPLYLSTEPGAHRDSLGDAGNELHTHPLLQAGSHKPEKTPCREDTKLLSQKNLINSEKFLHLKKKIEKREKTS